MIIIKMMSFIAKYLLTKEIMLSEQAVMVTYLSTFPLSSPKKTNSLSYVKLAEDLKSLLGTEHSLQEQS